MFNRGVLEDKNFERLCTIKFQQVEQKKVQVVAAVIVDGDRILCVRRGPSKFDYIAGKWEFPGGKVEAGESDEEALVREIHEELEISVTVKNKLLTVDHKYPDFRLIMHSYLCAADSTNFTLNEHVDSRWLRTADLGALDWAAADIPIVDHLVGTS